ncbi:hypothetical protein PCANC_24307, partial [Puccinia coronata f. sp. avenae]
PNQTFQKVCPLVKQANRKRGALREESHGAICCQWISCRSPSHNPGSAFEEDPQTDEEVMDQDNNQPKEDT